MDKICFVLLCIVCNCGYAQLQTFSGYNNSEKDSMITLLRGDKCTDSKYVDYSLRFYNQINESTLPLRIFTATLNVNNYDYNKNIVDYIKINESPLANWLINDSVIAVATPVNDNANCYLLAPPSIFFGEKYYYNLLKPVLNKIDLLKSKIFYISGNSKDIFVMTNNSIYVVDGGRLTPFNEYYKSRCSIKDFRRQFNIQLK